MHLFVIFIPLQNTDNDVLKETLKKKMDQDVKLVVYNSKSRTCRGDNRNHCCICCSFHTDACRVGINIYRNVVVPFLYHLSTLGC